MDREPASLPKSYLLLEYIILAKLYVFGGKLRYMHFKNSVVRAVLSRIETRISSLSYSPVGEAMNIIYKGPTAGSKVRKLAVDVTA